MAGTVLKADPLTATSTSPLNLPLAGLTQTAFLVYVPLETVTAADSKSRRDSPVLAA